MCSENIPPRRAYSVDREAIHHAPYALSVELLYRRRLRGAAVRSVRPVPQPADPGAVPCQRQSLELGKLALWPGLCAALVLRRLDGGGSRSGLCAAVLLSVGAAMALGAAGLSSVLLCPLAAAVGLIAYALALRRLRGGELLWYTARRAVRRSRRRIRRRPHSLLTVKTDTGYAPVSVFVYSVIKCFSGSCMSRAMALAYRSSSLNTQPQYFCI